MSETGIKWGGNFTGTTATLQEYFQTKLNEEYGEEGHSTQAYHKQKNIDILQAKE